MLNKKERIVTPHFPVWECDKEEKFQRLPSIISSIMKTSVITAIACIFLSTGIGNCGSVGVEGVAVDGQLNEARELEYTNQVENLEEERKARIAALKARKKSIAEAAKAEQLAVEAQRKRDEAERKAKEALENRLAKEAKDKRKASLEAYRKIKAERKAKKMAENQKIRAERAAQRAAYEYVMKLKEQEKQAGP